MDSDKLKQPLQCIQQNMINAKYREAGIPYDSKHLLPVHTPKEVYHPPHLVAKESRYLVVIQVEVGTYNVLLVGQ